MVVTRIAPSPTWPMHIWTARTALFCYLLAKQNNWKFLLRIEDTDKERSKKEFENYIYEWLKRLWLQWDWEVFYQSKNEHLHKKYIQQLIDQWKAYYAWETPQELEQLREEAKKNKKPFVYRQPTYTKKQIEQFKKEWRKPVVRFKVEPKIVVYNDLIKWEIKMDMSLVSDFVIQKSDGSPIFYIANVVDDHLQGITHVIRWEDHISNTPKQILLFEAFGWKVPYYAHMPLLLSKNWGKMSKRDTSGWLVTVLQFKKEWFLPEALINFIILLGWHPSDDREFFSIKDLIKEFSLNRVTSANPRYDFVRALWFNSEYLRKLPQNQFITKLKEYIQQYADEEWKQQLKDWFFDNTEYTNKWYPEIVVRIQTFKQFTNYCKYLFKYQPVSDEILYNKKMKVSAELVRAHLPKIIQILENIDNWTQDILKEKILSYIQENKLKNWQILWPIRAILTWVQASPGAFEMLYILWKEESINRLNLYLSK